MGLSILYPSSAENKKILRKLMILGDVMKHILKLKLKVNGNTCIELWILMAIL